MHVERGLPKWADLRAQSASSSAGNEINLVFHLFLQILDECWAKLATMGDPFGDVGYGPGWAV